MNVKHNNERHTSTGEVSVIETSFLILFNIIAIMTIVLKKGFNNYLMYSSTIIYELIVL